MSFAFSGSTGTSLSPWTISTGDLICPSRSLGVELLDTSHRAIRDLRRRGRQHPGTRNHHLFDFGMLGDVSTPEQKYTNRPE
jgi:hypothetical protein